MLFRSMNKSGVYEISGPRFAPKPYVGKTFVSFKIRIYKHKWDAEHGKGGCRYLYNAIRKYGWDQFDVKILHIVTHETHGEDWEKAILKLEEDEIRNLNSLAPNGYNLMNNDPSGGYTLSTETRLLKSIAMQGERNPMYGKPGSMTGQHHSEETKEILRTQRLGVKLGPYSEEHKRRISEALTGRPLSEQHKQSMSASMKARGAWAGEQNPMFGKSPSEENILKIRLANSKPVEQWTKDGSSLIATFSSFKEASEKTGTNPDGIGKCVNGRPKHKTAGGFIWKLVKDAGPVETNGLDDPPRGGDAQQGDRRRERFCARSGYPSRRVLEGTHDVRNY